VLASLDVELEPTAFYLKYAQADDMLDDIEPMLSERGIVQSDPRTNQLLVTDVAEHIDKIAAVIAKLDVETAKETFVVKHAEPDDIRTLLETFLPETSIITADERTRQVAVTTVADRIDQVRELVAQWDRKMQQVAIEAYILTANTERVRELGINWAYFENVGDKPVVLQRGTVNLDPTSALSLTERVLIGELPGAGQVIAGSHLSAVIDLLAKDNDTDILANPRILVNDGEVATFKNITKEPYQESGYHGGYYGGLGESGYVVPGRIQFIDVGTTLDVTPMINEDGWIDMEIAAEDSTAVQREIQSGTGFTTTVPVKTENSIITRVLLQSGETIVIGGLRVDSATKTVDKIPFFGDIPVLGHAFKSTRRDAEDRELLIFIRPEIVTEPSETETELMNEFQQEIRGQVVDADRRPLDLGGTHKPFVRRHTRDEEGRVVPFVPKHREHQTQDDAAQTTTPEQ
jgi:type II secretory pathway component GspD/PulD (secretin)